MEIEIVGLEELLRLFERVQSNTFLRAPMISSLVLLRGQLAHYPAAPADSSYRRTGTLGRSWTHSIAELADGLQGEVGTNVRYAPYVQSQQRQARTHQGRWPTDEQVIQQNEARIREIFADAVQQALNG